VWDEGMEKVDGKNIADKFATGMSVVSKCVENHDNKRKTL
jgi:hypothetical protein